VNIVRVKEAKLTYPLLSSFLAQVTEIVDAGALRLVLDLEEVAYIESATIGCLLDIHKLLRRREGTLKLSGLQRRVETILFMTGVQRIVDVHRTEAEAVAAFGPTRTPAASTMQTQP
jgi:anti-anti-sigma factor